MNEREREEFWKDSTEYDGLIPSYRFHDEWFYMVNDSTYVPIDEYTLRDALDVFDRVTDGENCSIYLYRGSEHAATYNGLQTEPYGEVTYEVTKSALPEWLAALAGRV